MLDPKAIAALKKQVREKQGAWITFEVIRATRTEGQITGLGKKFRGIGSK